jgi:hypothetical protein
MTKLYPSNEEKNDDGNLNYQEMMKEWESDPPPDTTKHLQKAGMVVGASIAVILGLTAPFVFVRSPLPYMATPGSKIRLALQYLGKGSDPQRNLFVDLGSGDGEAVYQAARLGYRAVGIELNFTMWAFSSLRRMLFWSPQEKANSTILWKNFFDYNLEHASTVMIFGVTPLMRPLSEKIAKECRPGTDILSYRFGLPLANSKHPGTQSLLRADVVYDQQEMRIYRYKT